MWSRRRAARLLFRCVTLRLRRLQNNGGNYVHFSSTSASTEVTPEKGGFETPFVIYDSAKHAKCRLTTRRQNVLSWYSCGPTVYDGAHIGHASSFIRQDVIRRIMESLHKDLVVIQVMGITDIDDKIIRRANLRGIEWTALSKQFEQEFKEDLCSLNVISPQAFTRVSNYIPQIMDFVGKLINSGYAYPVPDGSVYFDSEKYGSRYGLFKRQVEDEAGDAETETEGDDENQDTSKKSVKDFAVWKGAKPEEPYWTTPWGKGRPGWHIECSVMASQIFGNTLDLHSGGQDLKFPHHENEEAQCCALFDSPRWTNHWIHMGHLHFKGDVKMSKSLGNTVTIRNFLDEHSPDVLRALCIISKYRKHLEYSPDCVDNAKKVLKKFHNFINDTSAILSGSKLVQPAANIEGNGELELWGKLENARGQLHAALLDDFDTPLAIKILIEFMSDFNRNYVPVDSSSSTNNNYCNRSVNFELVLVSKIFVQEFLNSVGFVGFGLGADSKIPGAGSASKVSDGNLENVLNHLVKFRNDVRSYSLATGESNKDVRKQKMKERRELLNACDNVRNQLLAENHIEIKDHGTNSSWSFVEESSERNKKSSGQ